MCSGGRAARVSARLLLYSSHYDIHPTSNKSFNPSFLLRDNWCHYPHFYYKLLSSYKKKKTTQKGINHQSRQEGTTAASPASSECGNFNRVLTLWPLDIFRRPSHRAVCLNQVLFGHSLFISLDFTLVIVFPLGFIDFTVEGCNVKGQSRCKTMFTSPHT